MLPNSRPRQKGAWRTSVNMIRFDALSQRQMTNISNDCRSDSRIGVDADYIVPRKSPLSAAEVDYQKVIWQLPQMNFPLGS